MLRKLALISAIVALVSLPVSVQAIGFGAIKLRSALNQPLNAEVDLISPTEEDLNSLTVSLASHEAFLRAGIDRPVYLTELEFQVKKRSGSSHYIHVTSKQAVREPFMNILLEMNWKNGRMLREYTMLLDPPGGSDSRGQLALAPEPTVVVAAPEPQLEVIPEPAPEQVSEVTPVTTPAPVVDAPAPVSDTAPAPVAETSPEALPEPEAAESGSQLAESVAAEPDPFAGALPAGELFPRIPIKAYKEEPSLKSEEANVVSRPEPQPMAAGELDYGITRKNDNLWTIAEKLRPNDSVSVYQVMMALLKSNPDAFIDNNVNRLKVGQVLRIDDPSLLHSMSHAQAVQAYNQQTREWHAYLEDIGARTAKQAIQAGDQQVVSTRSGRTGKAGELTLAAPEGEAVSGSGNDTGKEALSNDLATLREQLRQARSDASTMRTRNDSLNNKLRELEDKLDNMQRSMSVKDDELAALQSQLRELNKETATAAKAEKPAITEQQPARATVETAKPEVKEAAEVKEPEVAKQETAAVAEAPATTEQKQPEPAKPSKPSADKPQPSTPVVFPPPPPPAEEGIMDIIMGVLKYAGDMISDFFGSLDIDGILKNLNLDGFVNNVPGGSLIIIILLPVLLVVLIIAMVVVRRRRKGDKFQESILSGNPLDGIDGDSTTFSEESSFLSDFAMSGTEAIQTEDSEVDPLTEADVFIAYGRYEAAEERLTDAIHQDPNRLELHSKLLEVYHSTRNKSAFENAAEQFYATLGNAVGNPMWDKVVAMGSELAPDNPLFNRSASQSMAATAIADTGLGMSESQVMDIGLGDDFMSQGSSGMEDLGDMDFNLDLDSLDTGGSAGTAAAGMDLDFNLDLGSLGGGGELAGQDSTPAMDFNLDMGSSAPAAAPAQDMSMDMDFNLDVGSSGSTEDNAMSMDFNMDMADSGSSDDGGMDFNLDMGESASSDAGLDFGMDLTDSGSDDAGLDFGMDMGSDDSAFDLSMDMAESSADMGGLDFGLDTDQGMDLNLDAADAADLDMGGSDEVSTKLDLAKAYIDMGDPDGARSILDEVLDEGSDSQRQEAQQLIQQIA